MSNGFMIMNWYYGILRYKTLPVTVLPLASVTTTVSTVVGTVAVTGLPLASKENTLLKNMIEKGKLQEYFKLKI